MGVLLLPCSDRSMLDSTDGSVEPARCRRAPPPVDKRATETLLSLVPLTFSCFPETLTLARWPPSNRRRPPRIGAARDLPEQIEVGQKLRRISLYLLVHGIEPGSPESSPSSSSSSAPAVARRARLSWPPTSSVPDEHIHATRVSCWSSGTSSPPSSHPSSPYRRSSP